MRNAPILVLDEATAALDAQAEAEVQAAIDRARTLVEASWPVLRRETQVA